MVDLKLVKGLAEQMLMHAAELLRLVDDDENERRILIENAKKTPTGMLYTSLA